MTGRLSPYAGESDETTKIHDTRRWPCRRVRPGEISRNRGTQKVIFFFFLFFLFFFLLLLFLCWNSHGCADNEKLLAISYALIPQRSDQPSLEIVFVQITDAQRVGLVFCFCFSPLLIAILHLPTFTDNTPVWEKGKELPWFRSRSRWEWLYVIFWHKREREKKRHHLRTSSQGPDLAPPKFPNMHFNICHPSNRRKCNLILKRINANSSLAKLNGGGVNLERIESKQTTTTQISSMDGVWRNEAANRDI